MEKKKNIFAGLKESVVDLNDKTPITKSETIEKKEVKKKNKKVSEKSQTTISLDANVYSIIQLYCKIENVHLSSIINDYLKKEFIPNKKVKSIIKNFTDSM